VGRVPDDYPVPAGYRTTRYYPDLAEYYFKMWPDPGSLWWFLQLSTIPHAHTHSHTHPFNGSLSGTTQVSRYQKGKTNLDFTEASDSEWQWHQLGHMHVCTLLQTDNHTSNPPLCFYRSDALPVAQPTVSKHWRQLYLTQWNAKWLFVLWPSLMPDTGITHDQ